VVRAKQLDEWTKDFIAKNKNAVVVYLGQTNSERAVARTHNIRLKEIKKRRALFGNQTFVHLTNSVALTNIRASNLFFVIPSIKFFELPHHNILWLTSCGTLG
jgi:hypothetical protein